MKSLSPILLLALLIPFSFGCANVSDRIARGVERGAERAAEREASRQADQAVTSVMRSAEGAIVCIVTDEECIENARRNGEAVEVRDRDGNVVETYPAPGGENVNPNFTPGSRVLFFEDFRSDPVGNFPSNLEFVNGNWEIADWNGRRLLRNTGPRNSAFRVILPEQLPDHFTVEMDVYFSYHNQQMLLLTQPPSGDLSAVDYNYFIIDSRQIGVTARGGMGLSTSVNDDDRINEGILPLLIEVDGDYAKVYLGSNRVANIPNAVLPRTNALHFQVTGYSSEEHPMYIGSIRVATD